VIIDDPHSEQDVLANAKAEFEKTWQWYLSGPRQRLQPGAAILVVMTRWGELDLTGQLIKQATEDEHAEPEEWEVIQLPALLPSGQSLWPAYWPRDEMEQTRATMPVSKWQAQYQQTPTSDQGAIIKREWWQDWTRDLPPVCDFVVQAWDTAYSDKSSANRSACVTWGEFCAPHPREPERKIRGVILLDVWRGRVNFPELKQKALELYQQWKPDSLVVEAKATGTSLTQELWAAGIRYIEAMTVGRGNDKMTRTNAVSDMFSSGSVWAPLSRWWAQELVEEMAAFPYGESDDAHDAAIWGLLRIRRGGFRIATGYRLRGSPSPKANHFESGDQATDLPVISSSLRSGPLIDGIRRIDCLPSMERTKAIVRPSGDHAGRESFAGSVVSRTGAPPSTCLM
jgi:predicted phage terminase large subunit-like protein